MAEEVAIPEKKVITRKREGFITVAEFLALMEDKALFPEELVELSGLRIRTVRSRLTRLMKAGKVREIFTLKDMRMRRYTKIK